MKTRSQIGARLATVAFTAMVLAVSASAQLWYPNAKFLFWQIMGSLLLMFCHELACLVPAERCSGGAGELRPVAQRSYNTV